MLGLGTVAARRSESVGRKLRDRLSSKKSCDWLVRDLEFVLPHARRELRNIMFVSGPASVAPRCPESVGRELARSTVFEEVMLWDL